MECVKVDIKNNRTIYTTEKIPELEKDTDVIIKVAYTGVCGTDLHIIQDKFDAKDGIILGHEIVGTIHDISSEYSHLKIGDRVAINPNRSCGMCIQCRRKQPNFCSGGGLDDISGIAVDGGWAEYCRTHVSLITKLPESVSLEQGVLCEPLSCIIHGLDKIQPLEVGSEVLIIGAGIIGILWSALLHLLGHKRVLISEPNAERQKTVRKTGLGYPCMSWNEILEYQRVNVDYKADLCIDCSGNVGAMQAAIPLIRSGGSLLIFGVSSPEKTLTVSPYDLFKNEITIKGVKINTPDSFERALSFLESMSERYLDIEKLGIKTFPLKDHQEALDAFRKGSYTKIVFKV